MLTAERVKDLVAIDAKGLSALLNTSGYKGINFTKATFLGITNGGQFCYSVEYADQTSKVFLTYNHVNNSITADM